MSTRPSNGADPVGACSWRESAATFLLDALSAQERERFRQHVEGGCSACRAELDEASEALAEIDLAREVEVAQRLVAEPLSGLRRRLLERVAAAAPTEAGGLDQVWQRWTPASVPSLRPGLSFVPSGPEGWLETGRAGIRVKPLSVDADRRYVTMLVSMAAGTAYPRHHHAGREECYVLQGELRIGEERLAEGDFQVAEAGSVHDVQATDTGCLLLIVSSQQDELLS